MKTTAALVICASLSACATQYATPGDGDSATLVAEVPDAFRSEGVVDVFVYPEGCPVDDRDEPLLIGQLRGRRDAGPVSLAVPAERAIVVQLHFFRGNISCRANMAVELEPGHTYELRSDLKRLGRYNSDALDEYLCSFMIVGVRASGAIRPGEGARPDC